MNTHDVTPALTCLFAELVDGASRGRAAYKLKSGDAGIRILTNFVAAAR